MEPEAATETHMRCIRAGLANAQHQTHPTIRVPGKRDVVARVYSSTEMSDGASQSIHAAAAVRVRREIRRQVEVVLHAPNGCEQVASAARARGNGNTTHQREVHVRVYFLGSR